MSRRAIVGLGTGVLALGCLAGVLKNTDSTDIAISPVIAVEDTVKDVEVNISDPLIGLGRDISQRNDTHAYRRFDFDLGCGRNPVYDKRNRRDFLDSAYNAKEAISGCYDSPGRKFGWGLGLGLLFLGAYGLRRRR